MPPREIAVTKRRGRQFEQRSQLLTAAAGALRSGGLEHEFSAQQGSGGLSRPTSAVSFSVLSSSAYVAGLCWGGERHQAAEPICRDGVLRGRFTARGSGGTCRWITRRAHVLVRPGGMWRSRGRENRLLKAAYVRDRHFNSATKSPGTTEPVDLLGALVRSLIAPLPFVMPGSDLGKRHLQSKTGHAVVPGPTESLT